MIRSFRDRRTQALFEGREVPQFRALAEQAARRLTMLDRARALGDLAAVPGNRLEALRGDRQGQYSIRVNRQWRVCFEWRSDGPYNVEIVDYHG